jgi:hypothetical protein
MIDPEQMTDGRDPASELEAKEEGADRPIEDYSAAVGRVLSWFLEGQTLAQIGLRVLVATHKLRPDLIGGMSFQEIAGFAGFGRSAAHNLSEDFEKCFPVRGIHDRSTLARTRYRDAAKKRLTPKAKKRG